MNATAAAASDDNATTAGHAQFCTSTGCLLDTVEAGAASTRPMMLPPRGSNDGGVSGSGDDCGNGGSAASRTGGGGGGGGGEDPSSSYDCGGVASTGSPKYAGATSAAVLAGGGLNEQVRPVARAVRQPRAGAHAAPSKPPELATLAAFEWKPSPFLVCTDASGNTIDPTALPRHHVFKGQLDIALQTPLLFCSERSRWMWHKKWCLPRVLVRLKHPAACYAAFGPRSSCQLRALISAGTIRDGREELVDASLTGTCERLLDESGQAIFSSLQLTNTSFNCGNRPFILVVTLISVLILPPRDDPQAMGFAVVELQLDLLVSRVYSSSLLGYQPHEAIGVCFLNMLHPDEHLGFVHTTQALVAASSVSHWGSSSPLRILHRAHKRSPNGFTEAVNIDSTITLVKSGPARPPLLVLSMRYAAQAQEHSSRMHLFRVFSAKMPL
eukprot:CAMPEP_0183347026 /NCGR_PEP_ID=MMETSP0164_2-20130417/11974_1 /TAXON_ID=221442 /ORGANISM="Coccolithus pelagicus ssp braarudi, Strain PLY182g" /LENGTH=440 /DNA_ID=CAMNT_0025518393 /DNA_START=172 /DNA_END=1494 /DNA_ORIENTATION=+